VPPEIPEPNITRIKDYQPGIQRLFYPFTDKLPIDKDVLRKYKTHCTN
jgi:hypothetical protein